MKPVLLTMTLLLLIGCRGKKEAAPAEVPAPAADVQVAPPPAPMSTAHVVVYRTRGNMREQVPVRLAADGSIESYPHPMDLRLGDDLALPTELGDGWLMDNRGVGMNTVFLSMDYAQYAALGEAPTLEEMQAAILDRDPLTDLCDCGPRSAYEDPVRQLKELIHSGMLETRCKRLK
ncbi:MAG TPA: hypothetical protein PKD45_10285 [Flavobacteriales bacterium]|nr:hypothetical protein [Flavobacteriales bacterium]